MDTDNPVMLKPIVIKVLTAIILLWIIKGLQIAFSWDLGVYGVYPREFDGLIGVALAPIIHGSFEHLFSNTMALFVLVTALFYEYPKSAKYTLLIGKQAYLA